MFSTCVKEFECVIRPEATLSRDVKLQELTNLSFHSCIVTALWSVYLFSCYYSVACCLSLC